MKVLDLFSGIGGFSLGLERAGMTTVAFCEIEPFCQKVLRKHWPDVPIYDDIKSLTADRLRADGIEVDAICGGFPCQDISVAGKGAGIEGARSGLWSEYARIIGEVRPLFAIIENVPRLRTLGADRVLSDLEELGYSCEPVVVGAIHAGAPHRRQRAWLVAYPGHRNEPERTWSQGRQGGERLSERGEPRCNGASWAVADADDARLEVVFDRDAGQLKASLGDGRQWAVEPDVGRVAHGVPARVDRLRSLGNAVVPQIPEIIGRAIMREAQN